MAHSVTALNNYIERVLKSDPNLHNIELEGEISQVSSSRGHMYLTLTDGTSSIRCNIWQSYLVGMDLSLLKTGRRIIARGSISPYAKGGSYSFSITEVKEYGEGDLMAEFLRLKKKLEAEGLFDPAHKRPLPTFQRRIGVITSDTGAAVEDIKRTVTRKNDFTDLLIFPTLVQGVAAPASIIRSIALANEVDRAGTRIDVLIVGRGGGSAEDLAAFNDDGVARAIYASEIPVISAVGHESDFSIADLVADYRAATPTAAAEAAAMDTYELRDMIAASRQQLYQSLESKFSSERTIVTNLIRSMQSGLRSKLTEYRLQVRNAVTMLEQNDPMNILSKGYAAVLTDNGTIVSSVRDVTAGGRYHVRVSDGTFGAEAISIEEEKQ